MALRNVVLIGFMGSGKSSVARALAELLGFEAVDTDAIVQSETGRTVGEIFEAEGEEGFRARESSAVEAATKGSRRVVACGGGAIISIRNLGLLQQAGPIVFLRASAQTLIERLGDGAGRP
ncbi:MAG: shikimate kinase, partial [Actinomycetota bacterium]